MTANLIDTLHTELCLMERSQYYMNDRIAIITNDKYKDLWESDIMTNTMFTRILNGTSPSGIVIPNK